MLQGVTWATGEPIPLRAGNVTARGAASPQVRDPARAASLGGPDALAAHLQAAIAESLGEILQGIEPSSDQLIALREDMAMLVLVSANMKLAAAGISLLDLNIVELRVLQP